VLVRNRFDGLDRLDYFLACTHEEKGRGVYTKDLTGLLQLLSVSGQNGVLHIEPPEQQPGEIAWQGFIVLSQGKMQSCQVNAHTDGHLLIAGSDALNWLNNVGRLSWRLEEEGKLPSTVQGYTPRPFPALPGNPVLGRVPQRGMRALHNVVDTSWARSQRLVFALIDGKRNIAEIAALLHKSPTEVVKIMADLHTSGFVEFS